jgi:FkbM family methyltransferase
MNHGINADREFFGYKMRTRRHYHDDHILRSFFMEKDKNYYRIPEKLKTVIDVGANIGCVSILCAEKGAEVFAFEPATDNFETLEHNIKINGYSNRVHCIQNAVGKPGMGKLYIHPSNSGATSLFINASNGALEDDFEMVEIVSIHDIFRKYNIGYCDLLKLDCEGAEKDIIMDLDDELISKIGQISLEYHGDMHERAMLAAKLSVWYTEENIRRYEFVYKKK